MTPPPHTVGRRERADLPEWHLCRVRVKVDTGAFSTALGVRDLCLITRDGGTIVRFTPAVPGKRGRRPVEAPLVGTARVRSSDGVVRERPLVETLIRLGPVTKKVRVTLTDRRRMRVAVLLGRSALAGDFVVDVSRTDVLRAGGDACAS